MFLVRDILRESSNILYEFARFLRTHGQFTSGDFILQVKSKCFLVDDGAACRMGWYEFRCLNPDCNSNCNFDADTHSHAISHTYAHGYACDRRGFVHPNEDTDTHGFIHAHDFADSHAASGGY